MDSLTSSQTGLADLVWWPDLGKGFYPVRFEDMPYDKAYFDNYRLSRNTDIGRALNRARVEMVASWWRGDVVDFGIGDGAFVEMRGAGTLGYDVNPAGVEWLSDRYVDYYAGEHDAVTFWDSLEHVHDIEAVVARVRRFAFVSMPIYRNEAHCRSSKHFKPNEHVWYFTGSGLIRWFESQRFMCREINRRESEIGREDIGSFVFSRVDVEK